MIGRKGSIKIHFFLLFCRSVRLFLNYFQALAKELLQTLRGRFRIFWLITDEN